MVLIKSFLALRVIYLFVVGRVGGARGRRVSSVHRRQARAFGSLRNVRGEKNRHPRVCEGTAPGRARLPWLPRRKSALAAVRH